MPLLPRRGRRTRLAVFRPSRYRCRNFRKPGALLTRFCCLASESDQIGRGAFPARLELVVQDRSEKLSAADALPHAVLEPLD
jgi:hypothetical protein